MKRTSPAGDLGTRVNGADLAAVRGVLNGLVLSISVYAGVFLLIAGW